MFVVLGLGDETLTEDDKREKLQMMFNTLPHLDKALTFIFHYHHLK